MTHTDITGKTFLLAGGSGSWGRELARQLMAEDPERVYIYSRGEIAQVDMERTFNDPRLTFVIGDVRDAEAVDRVMCRGIDYVFHLAALKHVPICENLPHEAVSTNILGTKNLIEAAIRYKVKRFVDVSTDKAVDPINVYGLTKAIGEHMTIQANCRTKDTEFIVIRGGNVIGTNGSLIPYVINQLKDGGEVKLTSPGMTRFFLTLPQAITLLLHAAFSGMGGETYVMNMPSFWVVDIIRILIDHYAPSGAEIKITQPREGEKMHEVLIGKHEVDRAFIVSDDYLVIRPQLDTGRQYPQLMLADGQLTSDGNLKDPALMKQLLKESGWL